MCCFSGGEQKSGSYFETVVDKHSLFVIVGVAWPDYRYNFRCVFKLIVRRLLSVIGSVPVALACGIAGRWWKEKTFHTLSAYRYQTFFGV